MSNQDVNVKEIDVIRLYNQKFGDFLVAITEHIHQLQQHLQEKQEKLQQVVQDIKKEKDKVEDEIRRAREQYDDAYNHGTYEIVHHIDGSTSTHFKPDYDYIYQCREKVEHMEGHVRHVVQQCKELGHHHLLRANQMFNEINSRSKKLENEFQNYVQQGRLYLDKVEQYIDQYKESELNVEQ